jgi:hypothetical protein
VKATPNRPIRMWPVVKFAVKRTAKVKGRIRFLINSIKHRNGFKNAEGEPLGWKWDKKALVLKVAPIKIIEIHKGIEIARLIAICLDSVKI